MCSGRDLIEYGVKILQPCPYGALISRKRQQSSLELLSKCCYSVRNTWTLSSTVRQVGSIWELTYLYTCRWSSPSWSVDSRRCSACHRWREDTWRSDTSHSRACSSCRATNAHVCHTLLKENIVNTSKSNVVSWLETNDFFAHIRQRSRVKCKSCRGWKWGIWIQLPTY